MRRWRVASSPLRLQVRWLSPLGARVLRVEVRWLSPLGALVLGLEVPLELGQRRTHHELGHRAAHL
eukprot:scaffold9454_cov40-Phaeocystis_antarctica.AAC.2